MDNPWKNMYWKDKYARERVIKSASLTRDIMKPGDTVVDVGCFTQEVRKYLPTGVTYIGIDEKDYHK